MGKNTLKVTHRYTLFIIIIVLTMIFMWFNVDYSIDNPSPQSLMISSTNTIETTKTSTLNESDDRPMKYILVWTSITRDPIMNLGNGIDAFEKRNCSFTNCYVSPDKNYLDDIRDFDAVVFHAPDMSMSNVPKARASHQKYVFASMESSDYYPSCDKRNNGFFNWTWTYKLDSDEIYGYIAVKNKEGHIVGPKIEMHWENIETMKPIDDELKAKLSTKKIAAAWFVSNCHARNDRLELANKLNKELAKHNLILDIYGACGKKSCPRSFGRDCLNIVERDYYFYLSFENSFSEDYVTEKLLNGLQHYSVPIVYGGANYTRFMPDGIYLNARTDTVEQLAQKMADAIKNKEIYYNYFRWHNHYSYHNVDDFPETDSYCRLCAMLNNQEKLKESAYNDLVTWWSPPNRCQ